MRLTEKQQEVVGSSLFISFILACVVGVLGIFANDAGTGRLSATTWIISLTSFVVSCVYWSIGLFSHIVANGENDDEVYENTWFYPFMAIGKKAHDIHKQKVMKIEHEHYLDSLLEEEEASWQDRLTASPRRHNESFVEENAVSWQGRAGIP